jgi:hypothetical protein
MGLRGQVLYFAPSNWVATLRARTADFQAVRKKQNPVPYVTLYAVTLCPVQVEGGSA